MFRRESESARAFATSTASGARSTQFRDSVRWYEFQGNDRVVLIPTEDGKGGTIAQKEATHKLTWEHIK